MSCSVTHSPYQPGDARLLRHCEAIDCSESGALCMVTSALSGRIWDGCLWVFNSPRGLNVDTTTSSPAACASADLSLPVETGLSDVVWAGENVIAASSDAGCLSLFRYSRDNSLLEAIGDYPKHDGMVMCLAACAPSGGGGNAAATPDVITGGSDGRVVRWNLERCQATEDIRAHTTAVKRVVASVQHPGLLATCALGDRSLIWDMRASHVSPCRVLPVGQLGTAAAFSVEDSVISVGCVDGQIKTLDLRNLSEELFSYSQGDNEVTRLAFAKHLSTPTMLASCGGTLLSHVQSVPQNATVQSWHTDKPTAVARGLCWSKNGLVRSCGLNFGVHTVQV